MKKISKRNTISVMDDMLKLGSTFTLRLSAIGVNFYETGS